MADAHAMTRRSKGARDGGGNGGGNSRPRLQRWQRDRVFRPNRGWVPVKRCAACRKTCHVDQAGEWRDLHPGMPSEEVDAAGQPLRVGDWHWYCGLHCLRDATPAQNPHPLATAFVRFAEAFEDGTADDPRREEEGRPDPGLPLGAVPGKPGHIEPARTSMPRVSWADDVDGLQFGQFPPRENKNVKRP